MTTPNWVIDLVIALQHHEDTHAAGAPGCLASVLDSAPADVLDAASAVAEYKRQATTEPPAGLEAAPRPGPAGLDHRYRPPLDGARDPAHPCCYHIVTYCGRPRDEHIS